jgi:predicted RNase H-like nuclease
MTYARFIGVDGYKTGWFYVGIDSQGDCEFGVSKTLPELWRANRKGTLLLADIPIGLPSEKAPIRACDRIARKLLGPRRSSVFSPPCRQALSQATYAAACDINAAVTGRKISKQTWNIAPRIREVEDLVQGHPEARADIRECHPEICFYGLNHGRPMEHYKKTKDGLQFRLELLTAHFEQSRAVFKAAGDRFLRKEVAQDDIVDALVAAVTGFLSKGDPATFPDPPEKDELGLPMEMVYQG